MKAAACRKAVEFVFHQQPQHTSQHSLKVKALCNKVRFLN